MYIPSVYINWIPNCLMIEIQRLASWVCISIDESIWPLEHSMPPSGQNMQGPPSLPIVPMPSMSGPPPPLNCPPPPLSGPPPPMSCPPPPLSSMPHMGPPPVPLQGMPPTSMPLTMPMGPGREGPPPFQGPSNVQHAENQGHQPKKHPGIT